MPKQQVIRHRPIYKIHTVWKLSHWVRKFSNIKIFELTVWKKNHCISVNFLLECPPFPNAASYECALIVISHYLLCRGCRTRVPGSKSKLSSKRLSL